MVEAISYLSLGKSFLGASDSTVVRQGEGFFVVEGHFEGDERASQVLRVASVPGEGRRAFSNGSSLDRLSDLVGRAPLVVVSPSDYDLTAGGPAMRRQFLDMTLGQSYPVYLEDLIAYKRALKQKGALLQRRGRNGPVNRSSVRAWNHELATIGGRLVERRRTFLAQFSSRLEEAFDLLGSPGDKPTLRYEPTGVGKVPGEAASTLAEALERTFEQSLRTGQTYVGPHRDEVVFYLGDLEVRPYASQGQHRTFSLSLRVAQSLFMCESTGERPLILMDDLFGPLDHERSRVILELLASGRLGQSFLTSAQPGPIRETVPFEDEHHSLFHVERGEVTLS